MGTSHQESSIHIMKISLVLSFVLASCLAAPENRFTCSECVREMHGLGHMVQDGGHIIHDYLVEHYCPTVHDVEFCIDGLSRYYVGVLAAMSESTHVRSAFKVWTGWE